MTAHGPRAGVLSAAARPLGRLYFGWWIVAGVTALGVLTGAVYYYGFSVFFIPLTEEFHVGYGAVSTVAGLSYLIGLTSPLFGALMDRHGPRWFMPVGVALMGLGFVLMSTATSIQLFYVYFLTMVALGNNLGISQPTSVALANWFVRRRGTAFGIYNTGLGIGAALVVLVRLLIEHFGWRTTVFAMGLAVWAMGFPMVALMRHRPEQYGLRPDGDGPQTSAGKTVQATGLEEPAFTPRQALASRTFWLIYGAFAMRMMVSIGVIVHFIPALKDKGLSQDTGAALLVLFGILGVPSRFLAGALGDRWDKRLVFGVMGACTFLSVLTLTWADSLWQAVLFVALFSTGIGGSGTLMGPIGAESFGRRSFGAISGMGSLLTVAGTAAGPILAGFLYDATHAYTLTLYIYSAIAAASIALLAVAGHPRPRPSTAPAIT